MPLLFSTTFVDDFTIDHFASGRYKRQDGTAPIMGHTVELGTGIVFIPPPSWGVQGQYRQTGTEDPFYGVDETGWTDTQAPTANVSSEVWIKWRDITVGPPLVNPADFQPPGGPTNWADLASGFNVAAGSPTVLYGWNIYNPPDNTSDDPDAYAADLHYGLSGITLPLADVTPGSGEVRVITLADGTATATLTQDGVVTETVAEAGGPLSAPFWDAYVQGGRIGAVVEEIGWTIVSLDPGPPPPGTVQAGVSESGLLPARARL